MKQHFVPECYLRGFSDQEGFLYTLNLQGLRKGWSVGTKRMNVSGICYEHDFYEVPNSNHPTTVPVDHYPNNFVESQVLGVNESIYPNVLKKFITNRNLTIEDYFFFTDFIILLKLRNPVWRKRTVEFTDKWISTLAPSIYVELENHPEYMKIPEPIRFAAANYIVHTFKTDKHIATKLGIHSLIERMNPNNSANETIRNTMLNSNWTLLEVPENSKLNLITSDNPGFSFNSKEEVENILLTGDFQFYLPLNNKFCLKISSRGNPSQKPALGHLALNMGKLSEGEVNYLNLAASQHVNKYIIGDHEIELTTAKGKNK